MKTLSVFALGLTAIMAGALRLSAAQDASEPDPIESLQSEIAFGRSELAFEPDQGYLRSILKQLKIDPDSQTLVFSKSSMQSSFIGPETPRAIYFNDDTYVGWIPGAPLIEIMSIDPETGVQFYTLKNQKLEKPTFAYETQECFRCHGGRSSSRAPGLIARSSFVAPSGYPRVLSRTYSVDPSTPIKNRWGGWYVSGTHGDQRHMGNEQSIGTDEKHEIDVEKGANLTNLTRYFETNLYLTPHSDIVALMVLEQQMTVQNALSNTSLRVQALLARNDGNKDLSEEVASACEPLVEALLCVGETKLTSPILGSSPFAKKFAQTAPKDNQGRSLSDLDLTARVLKYACSPLVYSRSFESLPQAAKKAMWKRLKEILTGDDPLKSFSHLTVSDRKALFEILRDTKPEFAIFITTH